MTIKEIHGTLKNGLTVNADLSILNKPINEDELYLLYFYMERYKRFSKSSVVFPISKRYIIDFFGCETYKDVIISKNIFDVKEQ